MESFHQRFIASMDDDLNTSGALAVLFDLARPLRGLANRLDRGDQPELPANEKAQLEERWTLLRELAAVLGLRSECTTPEPAGQDVVDAVTIEKAIADRKEAKQAKNYPEADRIRKTLSAQGIELIDKPGGLTDWRRV